MNNQNKVNSRPMSTDLNSYEKLSVLSSEKRKRFGTVFLLKRKSDNELFVLKEVEKSNILGSQQLQHEALFTFNVLGLPEILYFEETETTFRLIKTYQEGILLPEFWKTIKRRNRKATFQQLVLAFVPIFAELEQKRIVHCDIKPDNILVQKIDNQIFVSLIDFGLAIQLDNIPQRKTVFQLVYAPPELVLNRLNCINFSSDIFSFCLVAFKLFSGQLPFHSTNPALITQLQITYPIERPWRMRKEIWSVLEKGLTKHQFQKSPNHYALNELDYFLKKAVGERYTSFTEFSDLVIDHF